MLLPVLLAVVLPADLLVAETEDLEVEEVVDLEPTEDLVEVLLPLLPDTLPVLLVVARVEEERVTAEFALRLLVLLLPPVALCLELEVEARLTAPVSCLPCSVEFLLPQ